MFEFTTALLQAAGYEPYHPSPLGDVWIAPGHDLTRALMVRVDERGSVAVLGRCGDE